MNSILDNLANVLQQEHISFEDGLPPVDQWNPELSGDIDIRIDREGRWFHEGSEFQRKPLVKLFSSILKLEGNDYFLVTPVEKWRIQVDIAPFIIHSVRIEKACLVMTTNIGNEVVVDQEHPLWVEADDQQQPLPFINVQRGFKGLLSRNVFYQLVEWANEEPFADSLSGEVVQSLVVKSAGCRFSLGAI